jgi:hypothetical protein
MRSHRSTTQSEYLAADPETSEMFNIAMAGGARARLAATLDYDCSGASIVADIGGGNGALLSAILAEQELLRGIVFDLPHVVAEARAVIEAAGLARRELVGGDFFEDALPGADTYLLAQILHDWDDDRAAAILRTAGAR